MKLQIINSGTEEFPFYQIVDEKGNEFCTTESEFNARLIVDTFKNYPF